MQNMCKNQNMQNMLSIQNMQNNMYKICNEYACKCKKYAENAKYAKSFSDIQNM